MITITVFFFMGHSVPPLVNAILTSQMILNLMQSTINAHLRRWVFFRLLIFNVLIFIFTKSTFNNMIIKLFIGIDTNKMHV